MAITYNPARVIPSQKLIEAVEARIEELNNTDGKAVSHDEFRQDLNELNRYLNVSRAYLIRIKSQCNALIDSKMSDATCLKEFSNQIDLNMKPSELLNKAYTIQTFNEDETKNVNREQAYIVLGETFAEYCKNQANTLTEDQILFNDVGSALAAINGAISQMDRTKSAIKALDKDSGNDDYLRIFLNLQPLVGFIQILTDEVADKKPTILNSKAGILANVYDDLLEMLETFKAFLNTLFKLDQKQIAGDDFTPKNKGM